MTSWDLIFQYITCELAILFGFVILLYLIKDVRAFKNGECSRV